ncbi:uncharacterized protein LOC134222137 [Armigeres subalbatus]|uniref:uncharacterized protein LOC134222137 n=1 Tax=Armigeres subalbatus TaxID=124917 RepID=UPI002ED58084
MLIGAEHFFNILKQGQIKLADNLPTLYETKFGWVVAGSLEETEEDSPVCANLAVTDGLEACLQRFFHQEDNTEPDNNTNEQEQFEEHFQRTYRRNKDGRFVVQLPFRETVQQLGSSRSLALKRFLLLEKRLARNPDLMTQYAEFINEYRLLNHCREVREEEDSPGLQTYYLPHHCVLKPSSSSTKLRVVFDATAKTKTLMLKGGFPIRKWCSNSGAVLEGVPDEDRESLVTIQDLSANEVIKTLGLLWDPKKDLFLFNKSFEPTDDKDNVTKRRVLSQIAKIFDPLGLVSPVIVEIIMQKVWATQIDWDDTVEGDLLKHWMEFKAALSQLNNFKIPRCVVFLETETMEIHGFADASKSAYVVCIYLRCIRKNGSAESHLLCSKSKVAPLQEITIPRLELCANLLLAKLVDKVVPVLKLNIHEIKLWSDSQIALAWMKKPLDRLQVFVRNRVAEINKLTKHCHWNYIKTDQNPADVVSRGMRPALLSKNQLWWNGPNFLREANYKTEPIEDIPENIIPELKDVVIANPIMKLPETNFDRYDSFHKLQRVYAHIARFVRRVRTTKEERSSCLKLTVQDMRVSMKYIIYVLQQNDFHEELQCIKRGDIPKRLAALQPFIDENGLLRVGGRLQNSKLPYDAKHQLLLPQKHRVTELLIKKIHEERLHEGQSGVLAAIRQQFWILNARSIIRKIIHKCMKCFRTKPRMYQPLMGNLPEFRVNIAAPFELTGVDYAGPVSVKEGKRKPRIIKAYIALFVCLVSKAVHLELVSDLTSEAFLAALDRFVNRRGAVRKIFSDNGTNFVGAFKELRTLFTDKLVKNQIDNFLLPREVEWEFIPPRSPNFAALGDLLAPERGVQS